jgi:acetate CoA/acetoacetate CoA-transferase alpha subunit
MLKNKVVSLEEATAHIESGMTLAVGGFLLQGHPMTLIRGLCASDTRDLTIMGCCAGFKDRGVVELVKAGKVRKIICSHIGTTPAVVKAYQAGEIEVELVPQGTLAEQLRAGGAGLGGFLTPTGLGTMVAEGKQHVELDGKTYLLEKALRADIALVRAHEGDTWGNLRYRGTAGNYNSHCAACADYTIAEVECLCDPGGISPESVHTPGLYVDALVRADVAYCGSSCAGAGGVLL